MAGSDERELGPLWQNGGPIGVLEETGRAVDVLFGSAVVMAASSR